MVEHAGGAVLLPGLSAPLRYNKENLLNEGFVAILEKTNK
jgi:3'-phosphoadenosine 5'-phosphosulfate (PAPS) 3'-phosphatase